MRNTGSLPFHIAPLDTAQKRVCETVTYLCIDHEASNTLKLNVFMSFTECSIVVVGACLPDNGVCNTDLLRL